MVVGITIDDHLLILAVEVRARIYIAQKRAIDATVEHLYVGFKHRIAEYAIAFCPTRNCAAEVNGSVYIGERAEQVIEVDILEFCIYAIRMEWGNDTIGVDELLT